MNTQLLREALADSNVRAFLRVIREGESSQLASAYRMRYGGHGKAPAYFDDLSQHPRILEPTADGRKSSAAGAYQATWTTWNEEQLKYHWPDFSQQSQDEFAVARLVYRHALDAVVAGHFEQACRLCSSEWTSLPGGAEENAATKRARETYVKWGGRFKSSAPEEPIVEYNEATSTSPVPEVIFPKETPMAPALIPLLQLFLPLIPQLGQMFGSGSEVSNRNIAAGTIIAEKIVEATKSVNLQDAYEKVQTDTQALQAAKVAVAEIWPSITEVGTGGIKAAREAAIAADQPPPWKSQPFLIAIMFMPLIYIIVLATLGKAEFLGDITSETRAQVIGTALGLLFGGILGYFYGTSQGSQRKDSLIAGK